MFGLRLCSLLGVGRLVRFGFRLDGKRLGILGVWSRGHPVDAREKVEIVEAEAPACLGRSAPSVAPHSHPDIAPVNMRLDDGVAKRAAELIEKLPLGFFGLRCH